MHLKDKTPTHRDSTFAFNKRMQKRISKRASKRVSRGVDFGADGMSSMSIIELMHQIVREPAPRLGLSFCDEAQDFVDACLMKNPDERHNPKTLLVCLCSSNMTVRWKLTNCCRYQEYSWMDDARDSEFDIKAWAAGF